MPPLSLPEQIEKARARSRDFDLRALAATGSRIRPVELSTPGQLDKRRRFLRESLGNVAEAQRVLERIIVGNELQDANYLARGARAAKAVARIKVVNPAGRHVGYGTGFLIAPGVLLTNNHVLPSAAVAAQSMAEFRFELDVEGQAQAGIPFRMRPDLLFHTASSLDFTVVAVYEAAEDGTATLSDFGHLPFVASLGKVSEGEWLTIVQHPGGERKQVCVRENRLLKISEDVLWYSTDTLGGSSGSPVHNNDWYVVALHHSGVPETDADGRILTVDGRVFDETVDDEQSIKWIANEGIRVSRIIDELSSSLPRHPLLQPVFGATPQSARLRVPQAITGSDAVTRRLQPIIPALTETPISNTMPLPIERFVSVRLGVGADGRVRVVSSAAVDTAALSETTGSGTDSDGTSAIEAPFDPDYSRRKGFDEAFLGTGALRVLLPELSLGLLQHAARHIADEKQHLLAYLNYSVVMHAQRRLAIYTAANLDFDNRYKLSRTTDTWRTDPRIRAEHQISDFYYRANKFDRGHLTRREDLEFGPTRGDALASAGDTCHYTNCVPQHERFNRNKQTWHGIELHILENAVKEDMFRAQVFTGPVLAEDDPVWQRFPTIQYPVRFWKVVAAVNASNQLFATAFLLDQSEAIDQYGIEVVKETPIGPFKNYQVTIAEIERETGLTFWSAGSAGDGSRTPLAAADPLARLPRAAQRERIRREEALGIASVPAGYRYIDSLDAIYLGEA